MKPIYLIILSFVLVACGHDSKRANLISGHPNGGGTEVIQTNDQLSVSDEENAVDRVSSNPATIVYVDGTHLTKEEITIYLEQNIIVVINGVNITNIEQLNSIMPDPTTENSVANNPETDTTPVVDDEEEEIVNLITKEGEALARSILQLNNDATVAPGYPDAFGNPNYWAHRLCFAILIEAGYDVSMIVNAKDLDAAQSGDWELMGWTTPKEMVVNSIAKSKVKNSGVREVTAKEAHELAQKGIPSLATGLFKNNTYFIGVVQPQAGEFNADLGPSIAKGGERIETVNEKVLRESTYYYNLNKLQYFVFTNRL